MIFLLSGSPTPSCSAPLSSLQRNHFPRSQGVTFIKDAGGGGASCQSLGWVLEVYLQCGIARGAVPCSSAHVPFLTVIASLHNPPPTLLLFIFCPVRHWSVIGKVLYSWLCFLWKAMVSAAPRFWLCIASVDQSGWIIEVRSNGDDNKESRTWSWSVLNSLIEGPRHQVPSWWRGVILQHKESAGFRTLGTPLDET